MKLLSSFSAQSSLLNEPNFNFVFIAPLTATLKRPSRFVSLNESMHPGGQASKVTQLSVAVAGINELRYWRRYEALKSRERYLDCAFFRVISCSFPCFRGGDRTVTAR